MKLLVCIDGSAYGDNICQEAAWVSRKLNAEVVLLHVLRRHSDYQAKADDHTGAIGLGARSDLLSELTKVDEERARLDQEKGRLILEHGEKVLQKAGVKKITTLHRRGSVVDTVRELEDDVDMVFVGKRGEHANTGSEFLGANLEKTARAIHKPLFVVSSVVQDMQTYAIAYDGKNSIKKALEFVTLNPLLKDMKGYLIYVGAEDDKSAQVVCDDLQQKGLDISLLQAEGDTEEVIADFVTANKINLLIAGAYSHSRVRSMLLGSTTTALMKNCHIPLLLFRA